jgi:hypothetical protein
MIAPRIFIEVCNRLVVTKFGFGNKKDLN